MLYPKPTPREKLRKLLIRKRPPERHPTLHGKPVSITELRSYVFGRDSVCVAYAASVLAQGEPEHECRGKWGAKHDPFMVSLMTLAHVPDEGANALGKRAPDDELHTVTECYGANVHRGPDRMLRSFERLWITQHELTPHG